jgi:hypothetical protein
LKSLTKFIHEPKAYSASPGTSRSTDHNSGGRLSSGVPLIGHAEPLAFCEAAMTARSRFVRIASGFLARWHSSAMTTQPDGGSSNVSGRIS